MGGCKSLMLFFGGFFCLVGKRTRDFAFVSLCYGRSREEICTGYAMAASGQMQYDYKQTNKLHLFSHKSGILLWDTPSRLIATRRYPQRHRQTQPRGAGDSRGINRERPRG